MKYQTKRPARAERHLVKHGLHQYYDTSDVDWFDENTSASAKRHHQHADDHARRPTVGRVHDDATDDVPGTQ